MFRLFLSPLQFIRDRLGALEVENETLRQNLTYAQEAFGIVAAARDCCLSNKDTLGWTPDQVERLREIAALMRQALTVYNSCTRLLESEKAGTNAQVDELKIQLAKERSARVAAERKLSQYFKDKRKEKVSKVMDQNQVNGMN